MILIVNPMGRILVRWQSLSNTFKILCHPIDNWLYNDGGYSDKKTYLLSTAFGGQDEACLLYDTIIDFGYFRD